MTGAAAPIETTLQARARDLFLLERAERAVRAFTPEQHAAVRKYFDASQRRASVADDLSDDRNVAVAYVLYREAVTLLIAAVVASRDGRTDLESLRATTAFDALSTLSSDGRVPPLPDYVLEARKLLAEDEQLAFDRRASEDLLSKRKTVEFTLRWLQELIEPRTLNEIRATRVVRLFMTAVLVSCAIGWMVVRITRPVNIALGKPVTLSARHPSSTAPADNSGLVNGDIEAGYGIHTSPGAPGSPAWVMVDLLKPTSFKRVKIYNRADGWFDETLPLTLELSEDGTSFTVAEQRTIGFTSRSPWVYESKGGNWRFVRISTEKYVALTEMEIIP